MRDDHAMAIHATSRRVHAFAFTRHPPRKEDIAEWEKERLELRVDEFEFADFSFVTWIFVENSILLETLLLIDVFENSLNRLHSNRSFCYNRVSERIGRDFYI